MKYVIKIPVANSMGMLVNHYVDFQNSQIDGKDLEFGNLEQSKIVKKLETHKGRLIFMFEKGDVLAGRIITFDNTVEVGYRVKGGDGEEKIIKKASMKNYIRKLDKDFFKRYNVINQ